MAESFDYDVTWNDEQKDVELTGSNDKIILSTNSKMAIVNDEMVELDCSPKIIHERTFVPLRFIVENLGAEVKWNQDSLTIEVTNNYTCNPSLSLPFRIKQKMQEAQHGDAIKHIQVEKTKDDDEYLFFDVELNPDVLTTDEMQELGGNLMNIIDENFFETIDPDTGNPTKIHMCIHYESLDHVARKSYYYIYDYIRKYNTETNEFDWTVRESLPIEN